MQRLENHHIAGKAHSPLTVTLCSFPIGNHPHISIRQLGWGSSWNHITDSENLNNSYIVRGVQEILIEKHFQTGIKEYRQLADSLYPLIKKYEEMK